jgi:hypothetical protein
LGAISDKTKVVVQNAQSAFCTTTFVLSEMAYLSSSSALV